MKRIISLLLLSLPIVLTTGQSASGQDNAPQAVIRITGTRLVHPLFKAWIDAYTKTHPGITITLSSTIPADSADIVIVSHILREGDVKPGKTSIVLNRYVQLPVVNSRRSDVAALQSAGFTQEAIRQVYFAGNDDKQGNTPPSLTSFASYTVYKRARPACASIAFANHYGNEQKDIKGTGITGDDRDLLEAVKRDTNGISYNNLGFIYDLRTRRVTDSIAIVPIDLNGNGRIDPDENVYGTLDEVITFAEKTNHSGLPVENVHVIFNANGPNPAVGAFLGWILKDGQAYNHAYGFLDLDKKTIDAQHDIVATSTGR
jgi:phosphate transport system substrate-binding protein